MALKFKPEEKTETKKNYGMYVYFELFNKGLYCAYDVLILSYLIHLERFSPRFKPNNTYLMKLFDIEEPYLRDVFYRLIKKELLTVDNDNNISLNKEKVNEFLGFEVFEEEQRNFVGIINQ